MALLGVARGLRPAPTLRRTLARGLRTRPPRLASLAAAPVKEEVDPGLVAGLRIVMYPHPALRAPNEIIADDEVAATQALGRRMLQLMYEAEGVGLAAPQVGINKRLMVFNPTGNKDKWLDEIVLVNPQIVAKSEGEVAGTEGCLSFPDINGDVSRSKWIKVEAVTPTGRAFKKKFVGWTARIFQHEYDHLDGVCFVDRIEGEEKTDVQTKLDALVAEYGEGAAI
ncbi:peptide deformylase [Pelagophyceae sp. CCMP2097]|nr:peptide deformylase [Pelagophyceae sp. CCMP2097]